MSKILLPVFLCFFSTALLFAQSADSRYAGDFLEIPVGIRAIGMGTAYTAIADDGSSFYWNPSGSVIKEETVFSFQMRNNFGSIADPLGTYLFAGAKHHLGKTGAFSINWIRLSVDDIYYLDDIGQDQGVRNSESKRIYNNLGSIPVFSNSQDAFYLNFSKELNTIVDFGWQFFKVPVRIPLGINFKYIRQSFSSPVSQTGSGYGIDAGAMIITSLNNFVSKNLFGDVSIGINVRDVTNTILTWEDQAEFSIPRSVVWSVAYKQPLEWISSEFLIAYQVKDHYDKEQSFGCEFLYDGTLALRAGNYNDNLTLGAGIYLFESLSVDYAFQKHELGNPHQVGVSFRLMR